MVFPIAPVVLVHRQVQNPVQCMFDSLCGRAISVELAAESGGLVNHYKIEIFECTSRAPILAHTPRGTQMDDDLVGVIIMA